MSQVYNPHASKRSANLSINSSLLAKARQYEVNLSATLEAALVEKIRRIERERWLEDNKKAIAAVNHFVEEKGLFADSYRTI